MGGACASRVVDASAPFAFFCRRFGPLWADGSSMEARGLLRGYSSNNNPVNLRSANRNGHAPDNGNTTNGYQIASTTRCQSRRAAIVAGAQAVRPSGASRHRHAQLLITPLMLGHDSSVAGASHDTGLPSDCTRSLTVTSSRYPIALRLPMSHGGRVVPMAASRP